MESPIDIPELRLCDVAKPTAYKINIDSDGHITTNAIVRRIFAEAPMADFGSRHFLQI
jgi:hypothetical protein